MLLYQVFLKPQTKHVWGNTLCYDIKNNKIKEHNKVES